MAALHRKEREALRDYIGGLELSAGSRTFVSNRDPSPIENGFMKRSPWRELLGGAWEAPSLISREAIPLLGSIPQTYSGALRDAPGAGGVIANIEERTAAILEALPLLYAVSIELRSFDLMGVERIPISAAAALVTRTEEIDEPDISLGLLGSRMGGDAPKAIRNVSRVFLEMTVRGYSTSSVSSYSTSRAIAAYKHFVVCGVLHRLIQPPGLPYLLAEKSMFRPTIKASTVCLDPLTVGGGPLEIQLGEPFAEYANYLYLDDSATRVTPANALALPRPAATREELVPALQSAFAPVRRFLDIPEDSVDAEGLRTAMEWSFDADTTQNQTIEFLQRCIGLEAILGDTKKQPNLSERLAERYAYLVGDSHSQRVALRERFTKVYDRRGGIVHSRKAQLPVEDDLLIQLEAKLMLLKVIGAELQRLFRAMDRDLPR